MKLFEFETYVASGVKKYCFQFENTYTKDLLFDHLRKIGYTLRPITDAESYKAAAFKTSIFEKVCHVAEYNSVLWKWLDGKQPLNLFIMYTGNDTKSKTPELFQGPSEGEYLRTFKANLESKNIRFTDAGWNALIQRFRNNEKIIEDPRGFYNAAYSIGIQVENPDANIVNQFFGFKVKFWDLFNAIIAKDKRKSFLVLHTLLAEAEPVGICSSLQKSLTDLIDAKEAMRAGVKSEAYAYSKKMAPYRAQMLYQQAKTLDDPTQIKLLSTLVNLDLKLKSSSFLQPEEILLTGILTYFG